MKDLTNNKTYNSLINKSEDRGRMPSHFKGGGSLEKKMCPKLLKHMIISVLRGHIGFVLLV